MSRNHTIAKNALFLLGGGLVGAGAALLLAPEEGKKTRRRMMNRVDAFQTELRRLVTELTRECTETGEEGLELGKDTAARLREDLTKALRAGRDLLSKRLERLEKVAKIG